ncbi:MAG: alpha/beta hydrolase [Alphaproteobacteria bacterium]|nr:alpha/beta hydrolase [Alphaproteobacteria bacterium]
MRVLLPLLLVGCAGRLPGDDYFWFRSGDADMPVWVRGQLDDGVFVVYLQGGPGNPTQMVDAMFPEMTPVLDERYAMVYYDQRGSGVSVGDARPETMNVEQFATDLDVLLDILEERYTIDHLFLWGTSWGGTLGNHFLSTGTRQERVDGWIEMDGGENQPMAYTIARPRIMDFANTQIMAGERVSYWEKALAYYEANPERLPPPPDNIDHYLYVYDAGGYFYDPEDGFDSFLPYLFAGPFGVTYFGNQAYVDSTVDADTLNLHPQMANITIPTLLMWGREDLVVPLEVGEASYAALGTPDDDKTLLVFDDTAHTVPNEAPQESLDAMEAFIDAVLAGEPSSP